MRKIICLVLFACSPYLYAGTVYQWVGKDGSVIYSDEPPPELKAVEITIPDRQEASPSSKTGELDRQRNQRKLDSSRELSRQTESRIERRKALQKQLSAAKAALEAARQALLEGEEPRGGERIANATGGTRLAPAYFQRLESLKASVTSAEAKVIALKKQLKALGR